MKFALVAIVGVFLTVPAQAQNARRVATPVAQAVGSKLLTKVAGPLAEVAIQVVQQVVRVLPKTERTYDKTIILGKASATSDLLVHKQNITIPVNRENYCDKGCSDDRKWAGTTITIDENIPCELRWVVRLKKLAKEDITIDAPTRRCTIRCERPTLEEPVPDRSKLNPNHSVGFFRTEGEYYAFRDRVLDEDLVPKAKLQAKEHQTNADRNGKLEIAELFEKVLPDGYTVRVIFK